MGEYITIQFFHGGAFEFEPVYKYIGGRLHIAHGVDKDYLSIPIFHDCARHLGYLNVECFWYKFPEVDLDSGLKALIDDNDVHILLDSFNSEGGDVVQIYCVHGVDLLSQDTEVIRPPFNLSSVDVDGIEDGEMGNNNTINLNETTPNEIRDEDMVHEDSDSSLDDVESEYDDSDDLYSLCGDSDDDTYTRYPEFNEEIDMDRPSVLYIGQRYADHVSFKRALRKFAIENGFDYYLKKNNFNRVTALCKKECGWRVHASLNQLKTEFQIKSYKSEHVDCSIHMVNGKVTATWLANKYVENFRDDPNWPVEALCGQIRRDLNVIVSISKCYRAKSLAIEIINGDAAKQYGQLWSYCAGLRQCNPGTTVLMKTDGNIFQRLYVCLHACKMGFKSCRKIICLDGCHLKGTFGGQLLAAVGQDANNNLYPIAYAVVEAETKDSWTWFVSLLLEDIGSMEANSWTFMSDQQKGLVEAIKELAPTAQHRFCVRHIYANFNKLYKGKILKDALWGAARSLEESSFRAHMQKIKNLNPEAYDWLNNLDPSSWSRHAFSSAVKSDILTNNLAESFNKFILKARDKPIIHMLDTIRRLLMKRFQKKRDGMLFSEKNICHRIMKKLEKNKREKTSYITHYGGDGRYEIEHYRGRRFVVDLTKRTCSCRGWDISGIPCVHAYLGIIDERMPIEQFIDPIYNKRSFLRAYSTLIKPMASQEEWPTTNYLPPQPPPFRKQPGRPKKKRMKGPDELCPSGNKLSNDGKMISCSNCKGTGHNIRSCKAPVNSSRKIRKNKTTPKSQGASSSHNNVG